MITTDNLYFLLLQVFSSGVAGYITNKYAVNMIFKEYTPLKIGGAVKKNKEKFIEEISELVERDIINSSTIKENVLSENFRNTINETVKDFFSKSLVEVFEDTTIEDIVGIDETINKGEQLLRDNLKLVLPKLFNNMGQHLKVEDIISDEQINVIVDYIYSEISSNLEENENAENLLIDLYNEQKDLCLNELVSGETREKITRIISCEIMTSIDELLDSKKETKQVIDKVLSLVDIKSVMKDLQKTFGSQSIQEVLSEEGIDKLSRVIYKNLDNLIRSEEGNEKIQQLIKESIDSAKNIDLTIFELLPIHFGRTCSEFLMQVIKYICPYIITWVERNKEKIENLIDNSIYETIDNIDDDLRKSMILKVKDSMLTDFSARNNIVGKVNDFIRNNSESHEISSKLYDKIIKFLETTKIKDIVNLLEENNLIDVEKIQQIILNRWKDSGEEISKNLLQKQCSKSINSIMNQDFYRIFNKIIKPQLYDSISINKDKIMSYLDKYIFNLVSNKVEGLFNTEIKDLVSENKVYDLSKVLPKKISKYLMNKSSTYKRNIRNIIINYIKQININEVISKNEATIMEVSTEKIINVSKNYIDKYKQYEIKEIIRNISSKEEVLNKITEKTYEEMVDNLPSIVDGNVKKVIYDNLIKLDEDEICNIAQSFMGKQLKPLSMFGAFLGSIVGLIFGLLLQNVNGSYGFYNNIQNTLIASIILGGVGVMTNVIALWMIFCPYEKNNFVAKLPIFKIFAIGYIPAHKNSFASGMAYFIENELLSGKRLSILFKDKKNNIKNTILDNIISSKNGRVLSLIRSKQEGICKYLYTSIIKICRKNTELISKLLAKSLLQNSANRIISNEIIKEKIKYSIENLNKYEDKIVNYFENKLKNNKSMADILSEDMTNAINEKINNDIKVVISTKLESQYIEKITKDIILSNSDMYDSLMNKELQDVFSEKLFLNIEKSIKSDKTINILLIQVKEILSTIINDYINNEINEEISFGEVFDGRIRKKVDSDISVFTEKTIEKISEYAKGNVDLVSGIVIKLVRGNLNFFIKMAYDFADGDGLVKDVIENIINNKLETLLQEDKDEIQIIISNTLENNIYPSKITDLGVTTREINVNLLVDRFVYGLKQSEEFKDTVYNTSDLIVSNLGRIKVKEICEPLNINTLELAYNKCEVFINVLERNIIENIKSNIDESCEFIYELINNRIMSKFYSISLVEISWEINRDDISYTVDNLFRRIRESNVIQKYTLNICEDIYEMYINKELSNVLDVSIFERDINNILNILFENKDFNEKNKSIIEDILDILFKDEFNFISKDLKLYISDKAIDAGLNTMDKYIVPLLMSINLKEITLKEVEKMHPREIHVLFKSFAGDFFKKLYIYGGLGFVFGINIYLSIILLLIDAVYTKRIEDRAVNMNKNIFKD